MPSTLTAEQMKALAEYLRMHNPAKPYGADVGGLEDAASAQLAQGVDLQRSAPPSAARNDIGSNIGRAAMGMGSALRNYQAGESQKEASLQRRRLLMQKLQDNPEKNAAADLGGDEAWY